MRAHSAVFYRDLAHPPPSIVRGDGVYIEDEGGRRYLDASASAGVVGIGHGRTEIWDALAHEGTASTSSTTPPLRIRGRNSSPARSSIWRRRTWPA